MTETETETETENRELVVETENRELVVAARDGRVDDVARILVDTLVVDTLVADARDALVAASTNGHVDVVDALVSSTRGKRRRGWWRLDAAATLARSVDLLVTQRAFTCATEHGHTRVVERLLRALGPAASAEVAAHFAARRVWASNIVELAAKLGHAGIVQLFVDEPGVRPLLSLDRLIFCAGSHGHADMTRRLLNVHVPSSSSASSSYTPDPTYLRFALTRSCRLGHADVVQMLLAAPHPNDATRTRYDASVADNLPIQSAASHGCAAVVELLLRDARVDPSANNNYAIRTAAERGDVCVVKLLLTDARTHCSDALTAASTHGHVEVVVELLRCNASSSSSFHPAGRLRDNAPLCGAARRGPVRVVHQLLVATAAAAAAADDDPPLDLGFHFHMSLVVAAHHGHVAVVERLLEDARVDPSIDGGAVVRTAAVGGHADVVQLLLRDARADPSAHGNRALQTASNLGHSDVVRLLVRDARVLSRHDAMALLDTVVTQAAARGDDVDALVAAVRWNRCPPPRPVPAVVRVIASHVRSQMRTFDALVARRLVCADVVHSLVCAFVAGEPAADDAAAAAAADDDASTAYAQLRASGARWARMGR
jgi:ankyrin repeat protein